MIEISDTVKKVICTFFQKLNYKLAIKIYPGCLINEEYITNDLFSALDPEDRNRWYLTQKKLNEKLSGTGIQIEFTQYNHNIESNSTQSDFGVILTYLDPTREIIKKKALLVQSKILKPQKEGFTFNSFYEIKCSQYNKLKKISETLKQQTSENHERPAVFYGFYNCLSQDWSPTDIKDLINIEKKFREVRKEYCQRIVNRRFYPGIRFLNIDHIINNYQDFCNSIAENGKQRFNYSKLTKFYSENLYFGEFMLKAIKCDIGSTNELFLDLCNGRISYENFMDKMKYKNISTSNKQEFVNKSIEIKILQK